MDECLTVFVGNLPFSASEQDVRKTFEECGQIAELRLPCHLDTGKPKGCAIITYQSAEGVSNALEFNETDYDGRTLAVRKDMPKGKGKGDKGYGKGKGKGKSDWDDKGKGKGKGKKGPRDVSEMPEGCRSVIVKNLSYDTIESALELVFQDCGSIAGVKLLTDRNSGRSRGIGFVDFETVEGAEAAMSKFDTVVDGRPIYVDWSTPRPNQ